MPFWAASARLPITMMISSNRQTYYSVITFAALIITLVECSDRTGQHNPGRTKDEEDMDRYDKPFFIIGSALLLSVAPVFGRFVYSLFTDPVVPLLWKELNERGKEMLVRRFGNLGQIDPRRRGGDELHQCRYELSMLERGG